MRVGAVWEYSVELSTPSPQREAQVRAGTEFCRVVGREKIGGQDYFKCVVFIQGFNELASESVTWYRRAAEGVYRIDGKTNNPESLFLPLPPKAGQSWIVNQLNGKSIRTVTMEGAIDLPERSYSECIKLRIENADDQGKIQGTQTFFFAPGVGGVKGELAGGKFTVRLRLKKSSLSP